MNATSETVGSAIRLIKIVADAMREANEIPSGTIYAALMQYGCTMEQFEAMVRILIRAGLIEHTGMGLLRWIGPVVE